MSRTTDPAVRAWTDELIRLLAIPLEEVHLDDVRALYRLVGDCGIVHTYYEAMKKRGPIATAPRPPSGG